MRAIPHALPCYRERSASEEMFQRLWDEPSSSDEWENWEAKCVILERENEVLRRDLAQANERIRMLQRGGGGGSSSACSHRPDDDSVEGGPSVSSHASTVKAGSCMRQLPENKQIPGTSADQHRRHRKKNPFAVLSRIARKGDVSTALGCNKSVASGSSTQAQCQQDDDDSTGAESDTDDHLPPVDNVPPPRRRWRTSVGARFFLDRDDSTDTTVSSDTDPSESRFAEI